MKEFCTPHQILGTVTINDKGQIVIPIEARKRLGLKPGDQLMLLSKGDIALGMVKTADLEALVSVLQEEATAMKSLIKKTTTKKK